MGLIRKTTSVFTLGAVDFRSDKERIARYTRQTRNAVRAQTPSAVAAGWYADPTDPRFIRWWDGTRWVGDPRPR